MNKQDYYQTLGVSKTATKAEIKTAYRKAAMKYHPDRNPNNKAAEEKFKSAAEAYEVLSNKDKRAQYDQFGHAGMNNTGGHGGFGQGMNMDDIFENFGDIFGDIFGGSRPSQRRDQGLQPKRGHDLYKEITISLQEAFVGIKEEISYYHFISCSDCAGKGAQKGTKAQQCSECSGTGQKQFRQGFFMYSQPCAPCSGQGFSIPSPCSICKGQSRKQEYDKFNVTIPNGIFDNAELRISGKGDAGVYGGPAGDLFLKITVAKDKKFKRVQNDLVCSVMLTYPQLVLGSQVEIKSIDGTKHTIKIPKGCAVGQKITIPGKGFVQLSSKVRGNLIVVTQCYIPKKVSTEAKKALSEYSKIVGTNVNDSEGFITSFFKKFLG